MRAAPSDALFILKGGFSLREASCRRSSSFLFLCLSFLFFSAIDISYL